MTGTRLGHYRVVEKLGTGGMGEVYRAHDETLDRDVALKVLPAETFADPSARARLLREARTASQLNHPNICTIHEVSDEGDGGSIDGSGRSGPPYIAMELVEGQPLSARVGAGALPADEVLRVGLQLADALDHAHARGVVHRDLKSANVILTPEGRAKVLDFGLAKRVTGEELEEVTRSQSSLDAPGALVGTLAYMAPEQLRGHPADPRSDIWALGVVLYELAAGVRPFAGQTGFEVSSAILNQRPGDLPGRIPVALCAIIERCLAKEPAQRYQRAGEVRAALEAIHTGALVPWQTWRYRLARRRWPVAAASTIVLLAVVAVLEFDPIRTRVFGGAPRIQSLAVLPLENLSGDPEQDYFADGMTEALITDLGQLGGLKRVIARGSVVRYHGTNKPPSEIARELQVDALITGSVLRSNNRVRITAHLINAATEEQVWSESYERELRDVLSLQNEIVAAITHEIQLRLTPQEQARLATARPINPEAHEAYLRGEFHRSKYTPLGFETAMKYFQLALEKDPNYALAHTGMSYTWASRAQYGILRPREAYAEAKAAALRALQLDDRLSEAHLALAVVFYAYEYNWAAGEQEFRRALELDPNNALAHAHYGLQLAYLGRLQEGRAHLDRALELDPFNSFYQWQVGFHLLFARRYDDAIAQFRKVLEVDPDNGDANGFLMIALHQKGMYEESLALRKKRLTRSGNQPALEALERGYAQGGYRGALRLLADVQAARSRERYVNPSGIAQLYAMAGENERALEWLNKAYQEREGQLPFSKVYPVWDPLRSDPRFQELMRRMNFPE